MKTFDKRLEEIEDRRLGRDRENPFRVRIEYPDGTASGYSPEECTHLIKVVSVPRKED